MGVHLQEQADHFCGLHSKIGRRLNMDWKEVRNKIEKETEAIQYTPDEQVLKMFHHGIIESRAGSYGQYFTTLVFAEGDCRALAFYNANNLLLVAEEDHFNLDHLKTMAHIYLPIGSEFLGYCGLKTIWEFAQEVTGALDTLESKEDYKELISAFNNYVAVVHGWIHHYFPWKLGELFPQKKKQEIKRMAEFSEKLPD